MIDTWGRYYSKCEGRVMTDLWKIDGKTVSYTARVNPHRPYRPVLWATSTYAAAEAPRSYHDPDVPFRIASVEIYEEVATAR